MRVTLDAQYMKDKSTTHEYLQKKLKLPEHYGKNLDALWDLLSAYHDTLHVILLNTEMLPKNLGTYGEALLKLFDDAEEEILGFTIAKR